MKRIWNDIVQHIRDDFSWQKYGTSSLLAILLLAFIYGGDIEASYLVYMSPATYLVFTIVLFATIYYTAVRIHAGTEPFHKRSFWIYSGAVLLILSVSSAMLYIRDWTSGMDHEKAQIIQLLLFNSLGTVYTFSGLAILYWLYDKGKVAGFYGLHLHVQGIQPYVALLVLMIPILYFASLQPHFLTTYPVFKASDFQPTFGLSPTTITTLLEGFYLFDFIRVELLFRGALVIGMGQFLGKKSIVPMALLYCALHMNKPMMEAISSIFGGYILGVIAYYQRHILGGVLVHAGVAALMELFAYLAYSG